ncbi:MAG: hypothetical protein ACUVTG_07630, partial [Candidatus Oleimicrobiaceae bacterium]
INLARGVRRLNGVLTKLAGGKEPALGACGGGVTNAGAPLLQPSQRRRRNRPHGGDPRIDPWASEQDMRTKGRDSTAGGYRVPSPARAVQG